VHYGTEETIDYYVHDGSLVYSVFLDATKAFDRVDNCKLLNALISRRISAVYVHLLLNMYTSHVTRILWNGAVAQIPRGQGGHVPPNVGWGGDGNASCPPKYGGDFVA